MIKYYKERGTYFSSFINTYKISYNAFHTYIENSFEEYVYRIIPPVSFDFKIVG